MSILNMKPRHAAALALVGWYHDPPATDQGAIIYQDALLSQWTKALHFDSEADCEAKRKQFADCSYAVLSRRNSVGSNQ